MQRKLKNDDFKDIPTTPERCRNRNWSASATSDGQTAPNGRRTRTSTPGCSSLPSSGGRRSVSSTPESSLTQRELKKLEDYWTKNNPVTEDSPRLRNNRKVIFNLKDCLGASENTRKGEAKSKHSKRSDQTSLPESPIPISSHREEISSITNKPDETQVRESASHSLKKIDKCLDSPNIFPNLQKYFHKQNPLISPVSSPRTRSSKPEPPVEIDTESHYSETKEEKQVTNNPDERQTCAHETTNALEYETDSSDSDDDDYIPPRKKLRSEVTKDELWDGIPTISFKRLAPIPRASTFNTSSEISSDISVKDANEEPQTSEEGLCDSDSDFEQAFQREKRNKTDSKCINSYINADLNNDIHDSLKNKSVEIVTGNTGLYDTYQSIKRKRSMRLKEKLRETPNREESLDENNPPDELNINPRVRLIDTLKTNETSQSNNMYMANADSCSDKRNKKQEKESDECRGENLLKMTLSQILSVDTKSDIISKTVSNDVNDSDTEEGAINANEIATRESPKAGCVSESISKTINDIFEEIRNPNNVPETCEIKKESDHEISTENVSRMTRRSRRLSGVEIKSSHNPPIINAEDEKLAAGLATDANNLDDNSQDSEYRSDVIEQTSSKHKLFTKKINKAAKTVPPLRIKLKQFVKSTSKVKDVPKSKQKSSTECKSKAKKACKLKSETSKKATVQNTDITKKDKQKAKPSDSNTAGTSGKKGFTPKSKKKKTTSQRKWSPPTTSTIALRLNSERRLSAAGSLLSNPLLNNHACVLWSSENRRHMHLSNPHATQSELDKKLSLKWDNLSDKEKLRYFQRARDAIRDENRHSNRKTNATNAHDGETDTVKKYTEECTVENFQKLSPASQMTEIKKWLNFYNEISPETCSQVISSFKGTLAEENRSRIKKEQEKEKTKVKSKKNKQKKKEERAATIDTNANYRKILFEKIQDKKEKIKDILARKKREQYTAVLDNYSSMVKRMVSGEVLQFTGDVRSDMLTETLHELRALEKSNKLAVTGNVCKDQEYEDILARLYTSNSPDGKTLVCSLEDEEVDATVLERTCKKIKIFPLLSPNSLAINLQETWTPQKKEVNLLSPLRIGRSNRTSPVTVLTDMVAEDLLSIQPQIGFRKAISLLSNKVVPSPTLILPPKGASGSRSSANKNQNCSIVFTKLQNPRPSVLTTKVDLLN